MSAYLHRKRDQARQHGIFCLGRLRLNFRKAKGSRKKVRK